MFSSLEIAAAALFLLLSALLLAALSWAAPSMWTELDLRVAVGSLALTWLGFAWALPRGAAVTDPQAP